MKIIKKYFTFQLWQFLFILFSTSWLFAPILNPTLSSRSGLISQYEIPSQPFAWMFITGDIIGAGLLIAIVIFLLRQQIKEYKIVFYILLVIGFGMLLDAILPTSCRLQNGTCIEIHTIGFLLHATESTITALSIWLLTIYDTWTRKKVLSYLFLIFQVIYGLLLVSRLATTNHFNTLSQFVYQGITVLWLAWLVSNLTGTTEIKLKLNKYIVRKIISIWTLINGLSSIVISLTHIRLLGKFHSLYFAGDNAWLSQHSIIIGIVLIYLSRQLYRGEQRARLIFLVLLGIEVLKYSLISPNILLLIFYLFTFCMMFVLKDSFNRGTAEQTWNLRIKDFSATMISLIIGLLISIFLLVRDEKITRIAHNSFIHFWDFTLSSQAIPRSSLRSALLAQSFSTFLLTTITVILWILFRPAKQIKLSESENPNLILELLKKYSKNSEDYFKYWPNDKQYYWNENRDCFIAYRQSGAVIFALADAIGPVDEILPLTSKFIDWARARRLKICFLPVFESSFELYKTLDLKILQIGASALVDIENFNDTTSHDKWWRWQNNRAQKLGYRYDSSLPPHSVELLNKLELVSNEWLEIDGRSERGLALGYFNKEYLNQCQIHYLLDNTQKLIAFTNQLPNLNNYKNSTIDLLRYIPEANNSMPFLLKSTIQTISEQNITKYFDLGFVPFAKSKDPIIKLAKLLGGSRFSAKGLEQFKNKFDPKWQPNYLAYDGDLADLALITLSLEQALKVND